MKKCQKSRRPAGAVVPSLFSIRWEARRCGDRQNQSPIRRQPCPSSTASCSSLIRSPDPDSVLLHKPLRFMIPLPCFL